MGGNRLGASDGVLGREVRRRVGVGQTPLPPTAGRAGAAGWSRV